MPAKAPVNAGREAEYDGKKQKLKEDEFDFCNSG
jgi:hypothetical protein